MAEPRGFLISTGALTRNELRAHEGLMPLLPDESFIEVQYLDEDEPRRISTGRRPSASATWTCAYCAGVRFGLACSGCGAPRMAAQAVNR